MSAASYRGDRLLEPAGAALAVLTPARFLGDRPAALDRAVDLAGAARRVAVPRFDLGGLLLFVANEPPVSAHE
jgi:hypothetical protein